MRVCIITEGSYPFVVGGVSNCVLQLVDAFQDIDFHIFSICTTREEMPCQRCRVPVNVKEVKAVYVGDVLKKSKAHFGRMLGADACRKFINNIDIFSDVFMHFCDRYKCRLTDVLFGHEFLHVCEELYFLHNMCAPFNEFVWSVRCMYAPVLKILGEGLPDADVYHSMCCGYAGLAAAFASFRHNKPFILSEHGIYTKEREIDIVCSTGMEMELKNVWIDFFYKLSGIAYKYADVVTTLSVANKDTQVEIGCPEGKIVIVPNGVDVAGYRVCPVNPLGRTVGAVLRVVPIKDVRMLIVAFSIVKEKLPDAQLEILGNCDEDVGYYEYCVGLVKDIGVGGVHFRGLVDITEYMPSIDVMALSSISEGQPLAMLEGMACGKPFVVTDVGSCRELAEGCGVCVDAMDSDAMADAMIMLLENPEMRCEMGLHGRKVVEERYRLKDVLSEYRSLYESIGRC